MQEICIEICSNYENMIDGLGKIISIDENKFRKRKYKREKRVDGWTMDVTEKGTSNCFMCVERSKDIVKKMPAKTNVNDCWKSYKTKVYLTVNQSIIFKQG